MHTSPSTAGSPLLQPSNITQTSSSHSALSHQVTAANSGTTQVLFGNNIRLTVPSSVATVNSIAPVTARHIPRTLSAVPSSALKLAAAANCQVSKVPSASSVDPVPRWVLLQTSNVWQIMATRNLVVLCLSPCMCICVYNFFSPSQCWGPNLWPCSY